MVRQLWVSACLAFMTAGCSHAPGSQPLDAVAPPSPDSVVPADAGFSIDNVSTYVKASNSFSGGQFGSALAMSADGLTLVVGALNESSNASGVNGDQSNHALVGAGAVYVFTRPNTHVLWSQQAYLKASNPGQFAYFGCAVAVSADGTTVAVGARQESSAATGINDTTATTSATNSGAAYVFTRTGATWTQQAYVKASNTNADAQFGSSIALSANGSVLAVGAYQEQSGATGIDGMQSDKSANGSGATYVFERSGTTWTQQSYVKASNTAFGAAFGIQCRARW